MGHFTIVPSGMKATDGRCDTWNLYRIVSPERPKGGQVTLFTLYTYDICCDRAARLVRAVAADPGPDAAEDVTHDTFLRACWTLNIKRDPARVAPWLVGIA
jgi:hypothetical protein